MANGQTSGRWAAILRYTLGGALCLLTVVAAWAGLQWYWSVVVFCGAFFIILGRRRIFRAGVIRTHDELVCRYIPWYEGNAYFLNLMLPLMGVAMIAASYGSGNPGWLRFGGVVVMLLAPFFAFSTVRMWRRCLLRISPSVLTVRLAAPRNELTEIRRDCVLSIEPKIVSNGVGGQWLQVEIAYRAADLSSDTTKTVQLGLQLSVQPINLFHALVAWKDGANDNPSELLDRVERVLKGRSLAGV